MKKLIDLERNDCRWPLDDGLFCAAPKERGSYCETHAKRAYKERPTAPSTTDSAAPRG